MKKKIICGKINKERKFIEMRVMLIEENKDLFSWEKFIKRGKNMRM